MADFIKGPFEIKADVNILADISEIGFDYSVNTEEYDSVQGRHYVIPGTHQVQVTVQFLKSDVAALAAVLPQYHVANGGTLSTGETVSHADGAIDIVPGEYSATKLDFIVTSANGHVIRIPECVTEIDSVDLDGSTLGMVTVAFRGESATDEATLQLFREGSVIIAS